MPSGNINRLHFWFSLAVARQHKDYPEGAEGLCTGF